MVHGVAFARGEPPCTETVPRKPRTWLGWHLNSAFRSPTNAEANQDRQLARQATVVAA